MVKADIIDFVYEKVGFTRAEASEAVEVVFQVVKETLNRGEKVHIVGFGSFLVRNKKKRLGRNPKTGTQIEISPRRVLTFKPSQILKEVVNNGTGKRSLRT